MSLHELASAWLHLAEDINDALAGYDGFINLRPADLAWLGNLNERSLRNLVGPKNHIWPLRGSKKSTARKFKSSAQSRTFVVVNQVDALNWLGSREVTSG